MLVETTKTWYFPDCNQVVFVLKIHQIISTALQQEKHFHQHEQDQDPKSEVA